MLVVGPPDGQAGGIRLGLHDDGRLPVRADQLKPLGLNDLRRRRGLLSSDNESNQHQQQHPKTSRPPAAVGAFETSEAFIN